MVKAGSELIHDLSDQDAPSERHFLRSVRDGLPNRVVGVRHDDETRARIRIAIEE
jgi:hypothetical protein